MTGRCLRRLPVAFIATNATWQPDKMTAFTVAQLLDLML